jgi:hypothetical protein
MDDPPSLFEKGVCQQDDPGEREDVQEMRSAKLERFRPLGVAHWVGLDDYPDGWSGTEDVLPVYWNDKVDDHPGGLNGTAGDLLAPYERAVCQRNDPNDETDVQKKVSAKLKRLPPFGVVR